MAEILGLRDHKTLRPDSLIREEKPPGFALHTKLLLNADLLVAIANTATIRAVVANGRYYDCATLDNLLAETQAKPKREPQPLGRAR